MKGDVTWGRKRGLQGEEGRGVEGDKVGEVGEGAAGGSVTG